MTGLLNSFFYRPPFSPTQLANLFAWFDASDAASITHSSGAVSQWSDKSGNARHVTQSTAGANPTYSATGLAGSQPGITFDGGDKLGNTSFSLSSGTLIHAFAVIRPTAGSSYNRVVSFAAATGFDYSGGYIPITRFGSGNTWESYNGGDGTSRVTVNASNTAVIGSVRTNSSNYFMVKNGAESSTAALGFPSGALTQFALGARADSTASDGFFFGTMSEVIILAGTTPTSDERAAIQSYLAAKWTLT